MFLQSALSEVINFALFQQRFQFLFVTSSTTFEQINLTVLVLSPCNWPDVVETGVWFKIIGSKILSTLGPFNIHFGFLLSCHFFEELIQLIPSNGEANHKLCQAASFLLVVIFLVSEDIRWLHNETVSIGWFYDGLSFLREETLTLRIKIYEFRTSLLYMMLLKPTLMNLNFYKFSWMRLRGTPLKIYSLFRNLNFSV